MRFEKKIDAARVSCKHGSILGGNRPFLLFRDARDPEPPGILIDVERRFPTTSASSPAASRRSAPISAKSTVSPMRWVFRISMRQRGRTRFSPGLCQPRKTGLWQMDALRRAGAVNWRSGEGKRRSTSIRMPGGPDRAASRTAGTDGSRRDRPCFAAYARGVNFFSRTHRGRLPLEFTLLNTSLARGGARFDSGRIADVPDTHDQLARRNHEADNGGKKAIATKSIFCSGRGEVARSSPDRTHGSFPARAAVRGNPSSPTILISNFRFRPPGTWSTSPRPGLTLRGIFAGRTGSNYRAQRPHRWASPDLHFDGRIYISEQINSQNGPVFVRGQPEQARLERGPSELRAQPSSSTRGSQAWTLVPER